MSVGPVQPGSAGVEPPTPEKKVRTPAPPASADGGRSTKVSIDPVQNSPVPILFPEHEVKVVDDSSTDGILVYRTLDKKSGDLVTQVPSATTINEIRQTQELLKRIASRRRDSIFVAAPGSTPVVVPAATPVAAPDSSSAPAPVVKGQEKTNGR